MNDSFDHDLNDLSKYFKKKEMFRQSMDSKFCNFNHWFTIEHLLNKPFEVQLYVMIYKLNGVPVNRDNLICIQKYFLKQSLNEEKNPGVFNLS